MKKVLVCMLLWIEIICLISGCKKQQDEYVEIVPEVPTVISIEETVNSDGDVVLEVGFEDESKMYFILLDFETAAVTNRESFYSEGVYYGNNDNGYVYRGEVVIPSEITHMGQTYTITTIGKNCFADAKLLKSIHVPNTVTSIGEDAFIESGIREIRFPNSIKVIPPDAFWGCKSLQSVVFPDSLVTISNGAFNNCVRLSTIDFPKKLQIIGGEAFTNCISLVSLSIPESVEKIGDYAFKNCKSLVEVNYNARDCNCGISYGMLGVWKGCSSLKTINIGGDVEIIPKNAFKGLNSVTTISISESVRTIGTGAFNNCTSLTSISIPNSVHNIDGIEYNYSGSIVGYSGAFQNCTNLTSVTIGNSVEEIGPYTFMNCQNLESVNIPNSVKAIFGGSFVNCQKLVSVVIPESVEKICFSRDPLDGRIYGAFSNCSGLTTVVCLATMPPFVGSNTLRFLSSPNVIYVPAQSVDAYRNNSDWSIYSDIIEGL